LEDPGVEGWTTMFGADGVLSALRRELLRGSVDGGGDFSLGETGHCIRPSLLGPDLCDLGIFEGCSAAEVGCSCGTAAADRARWIAAAEGAVDVKGWLERDGLTSWEFFRERMPRAAAGAACCLGGRPAGEESRDDHGEAAADGERDAVSD